jgi:hypothetical protein
MLGHLSVRPCRAWPRCGWVIVAGLARGLVASASTVHAADVDRSAAKAHYEAATRLYDIHEYEAALKECKAGYLAKPDPAFLFNIG